MLDVDSSTDQFALAVIAQELLTGRNPHAGDSVAAIFTRVSSAPSMSVGYCEDLDAVLARALAKSSRLRFRSITDFSTAFRAAARASSRDQQRQAAVPATDGDARRRRRSWRRNWRVALGVTAMAVALCLVAETRPNRLPAGGRASSASLAAPRAEAPAVHALAGPQVTTLTARALTTSAEPTRQTDGERAFRARTRPPARTRLASYTTRSRSRPALTLDDDATMPPTEMAGVEPNP